MGREWTQYLKKKQGKDGQRNGIAPGHDWDGVRLLFQLWDQYVVLVDFNFRIH